MQHIIYRRSNTGTKFLHLIYSLLLQYHSCGFGRRSLSNTTMSSKLVKKLLQQTTLPPNNVGNDPNTISKRRIKSATMHMNITKATEEIVHEQAQSLLRLDCAVKKHSSNTAQRSLQRHTSNLNHQQNARHALRKNLGGMSNSRSSSSCSKMHERTFNKERHERKEEEGYFEDLARALKKAKKGKK